VQAVLRRPDAGERSHLRDHDGKSAAKGAKKREEEQDKGLLGLGRSRKA